MEAKFISHTIFEFQSECKTTEDCLRYLAEIKWGAGYSCSKSKNDKFCNGIKPLDRQCTKCNYLESPTAGTVFHKIKFDLLKAFWIVFYVSNHIKGLSSCELSRKLGLRQKTCWLFKQKVMVAMDTLNFQKLSGEVEVDELVGGQKESGVVGRKNKNKKLVVIAIEKKGKGVSRISAKTISKASKKEIGGFMEKTIEKESDIRTDKWSTYESIRNDYPKMKCEKSKKKGGNFKLMHRVIMGLKGWLRGTHHQVNLLQGYLDEYCYRFNNHLEKTGVFRELIIRMINHAPAPYKSIIA